jgi:hypothetical protein
VNSCNHSAFKDSIQTICDSIQPEVADGVMSGSLVHISVFFG